LRVSDRDHEIAAAPWEAVMLILVEGSIHRPVTGDERTAVRAWLGPMVDDGFLQHGYLDSTGERLWMIVSSPSLERAQKRLNDLPVARDGSVSFETAHVTALRFR
jgi:hypothetical protein